MKAPDPCIFYDVAPLSLNHQGEELCGDQVKVLRNSRRTIVVLSDGLGSGVKANILARLTSEIIVKMLGADAPLQDVLETVVGTLPTCKVRKIAYATFAIVDLSHRTGSFKVINFDSPPALFLRQGKLTPLTAIEETVQGKKLTMAENTLARGDFLGLLSDGVLYAGMGATLNFGWGWNEIGSFLERSWMTHSHSAERLVKQVIRKTEMLYQGQIGDDATFVGLLGRRSNRLIVFTGPPVDKAKDESCVARLLEFPGRKIVCGGTTANIVAEHLGETVETDLTTLRDDLPPIGSLPDIDLVTEGILTMAKALQLLRDSKGEERRLPVDRNGAVLLVRELLRADSVVFLAGEMVNPFYQNPLLPKSVSIRRSLLDQITEVLASCHKEVRVEWC